MERDLIFLLIDDDIDDQEIFTMALKEINPAYTCVTNNDGLAALKRLNGKPEFTPHFIFLDLNMPLMSGKECLREIKKNPRLQNIPVIIYSTSSRISDREETQQLGAAHFLIKPSGFHKLIEILSAFLQNPVQPFLLNKDFKD